MPAKKISMKAASKTQSSRIKRAKKPTVLSSPASARGVADWKDAARWLKARGIEDIECITPDLAGVPRGKMMPTSKFTSNTSLALPSALYRHTISGDYPDESGSFRYEPRDSDLKLVPDLSTLTTVPWESDPTAQVICAAICAPSRLVDRPPFASQLAASAQVEAQRRR